MKLEKFVILHTIHQDFKAMRKLLFIGFLLVLTGCVTIPEDTFLITKTQLEQRQLETRLYDGINETDLIVAGSNVLQDIGFTLENSEIKLGVLTGSKQREAGDTGAKIALAILAALAGTQAVLEKDQTIRVTLVVRPSKTSDTSNYCRVTFQRIVSLTNGQFRYETLRTPELYTGFFSNLSKSVFLTAQKI